tara:strand:- start:418 stop:774 length:357 start_codon:yes stop_codon:yes gene_type:complete
MIYYKVKEDFVVACLVGTTKSNHSYGSSRIYKPLWMPMCLENGDTICVKEDVILMKKLEYKELGLKEWIEIKMDPPKSKGFEKAYITSNGFHKFPKECLEQIADTMFSKVCKSLTGEE